MKKKGIQTNPFKTDWLAVRICIHRNQIESKEDKKRQKFEKRRFKSSLGSKARTQLTKTDDAHAQDKSDAIAGGENTHKVGAPLFWVLTTTPKGQKGRFLNNRS